MKKNIIILAAVFTNILAYAYNPHVPSTAVGNSFTYDGIVYEPISDTECRTKAATNLSIQVTQNKEYDHWDPVLGDVYRYRDSYAIQGGSGPNSFGWSANHLHETVYDTNNATKPKPYTLVEIGDFSFAGNLQNNDAEINIPSSVKRIGTAAFAVGSNCAGFKLSLQGVEVIDNFAFVGNIVLNGLTINNSENNTVIGESAFQGCTALANNPVILNGVKEIKAHAFDGTSITTLTITNSEHNTVIGEYAFANNNSSMTLDLSCVQEIKNYAFFNRAISSLSLNNPEKTTVVGNYAFALEGDQYKFETLNLSGVKSIGDHGFYRRGLPQSIEFSDVLTSMGAYAFANCPGVESVTFGNGLKIIPEYAFYNLDSDIKNVVISNSVEKIEQHAFDKSANLKSLTLGEKVEYIGPYAFHECRVLDKLTIPDATTYIGEHAFCHCDDICPLVIGKNVRYIGEKAFYYAHMSCSDKFELPGTLQHIGPLAFGFNRTAGTNGAITDLYISASEPPKMPADDSGFTGFGKYDPVNVGDNFYNVDNFWEYTFLCLHVPSGSYDKYSRTYNEDGTFNPWSQFQCIIDDIAENNSSVHEMATVGYEFIIPYNEQTKETTYLTKALPDVSYDDVKSWTWELYEDGVKVEPKGDGVIEGKYITYKPVEATYKDKGKDIPAYGVITGKNFGQSVLVATRTVHIVMDKDVVKDDKGNVIGTVPEEFDQTIVSAGIVVFVCPTITVVFDSDNVTEKFYNEDEEFENQNGVEAKSLVRPLEESSASVVDTYATYEHRVVYGSLPRLQIVSAENVDIEAIQHLPKGYEANGDVLSSLSPDATNIDSDEFQAIYVAPTEDENTSNVTMTENAEMVDEDNLIFVPVDPIVNNQVLLANIKNEIAPIDGGFEGTVGVDDVEITGGISLDVQGKVITVNGADDNDIVTIYDLNGRVLYRNTAANQIRVNTTGVFVVSVADQAFKLRIK